ncbi:MAG: SWIM zinc finger family protein [Acidobacteriota bacterium]|nr:SWIM zinc finger family protein [Acidobacteriota bacterium]
MVTKRYHTKRGAPKARVKGTPVISLTGSPPQAKQAWWSQKFIEVLESFKMGSRLARGKAYAAESKVLKLSISSGIVTSTVQGSRKSHYKVSIKLDPLSDNSWKQVMANLTKKAIFAVEMLQDKMPNDIAEAFEDAGASLFPKRLEDLESSCDCPDWSNPCKHIAATYYILAQHFDLDPFLIFVWRGRLKTQIIESLRLYWKQGKPKVETFGAIPIRKIPAEEYNIYWNGSPDAQAPPKLDPFSKAVPDSSIKKLGEAPVQLDGKELGLVFAEAYQYTSLGIRKWVNNLEDKPPEREILMPRALYAQMKKA